MKRHVLFLLSFFCFASITVFAQNIPAGGFGGFYGYEPPREQQMGEEQLKSISNTIQQNIRDLKSRGIIKEQRVDADTVKFSWPLRQAAGYNDPGYFGISNYLDWKATTDVLDFNCGTRTYDGHRGTDIYTYPFGWKKMQDNAVEIIAAADGIIVAKYDGNQDTSCANCNPNAPTCQWNAVYVRSNIDGTIVWYGHMKKNSMTSKAVGAAVAKGEYLGVVGSSGNSTGPHLHFEVWRDANYNWLIDPWAGTCNADGNKTYWETQEAYYVPKILKVTTTSALPQFSQCYNGGNGEQPMYKDIFGMNETVYFPVYIRDNLPGKIYNLKWVSPTGIVKIQQTLSTFSAYYSSAWLYYFYPGSNFNETGIWKLIVTYDNSIEQHEFQMFPTLPLNLLDFTGVKDGKTARLTWSTTNEDKFEKFIVERSTDGVRYEPLHTQPSEGSGRGSSINRYAYNDFLPQNGNNFYRLKMVDKDGLFSLSNVVKLNIAAPTKSIIVLTNPANTELKFVCADDQKNAQVKVIDQTGRVVIVKQLKILRNQQTSVDIAHLAAGNYYLMIEDQNKRLSTSFIKQ